MDIIALLLHISWDRKCRYRFSFQKQKRRQWFVFAFESPQIQNSLQSNRNRDLRTFVWGWGWGGGGAHAPPCGCTHAQTTHYGHTCDTQMLIHPLSWTYPYAQLRKEPSSTAQARNTLSNSLLPADCDAQPNQKESGERVLLLKEIVTSYWAYTEQVNLPVVILSPRFTGGKWGVGEKTAPFKE